jgi:hypothetical protein
MTAKDIPVCDLQAGESRVFWLGRAQLGRLVHGVASVTVAEAVPHDPASPPSEGAVQEPLSATLVAAGDWLGAEWHHATQAVPVCVTAWAPTRVQVLAWSEVPGTPAQVLTECLLQQQQRAATRLAMRSGSAEQRCRVVVDFVASGWPRAESLDGVLELPPLKLMAQWLDLAPETACRALAKVRSAGVEVKVSRKSLVRAPLPSALARLDARLDVLRGHRWGAGKAPVARVAQWVGSVGTAVVMASVAALWAPASPAWAGDTTPQAQLQRWTAEAGAPGQAERGKTFFGSKHGGEWSCATCHNAPPTQEGKHPNTGKVVPVLAPAFNAQAFTDTAKVDKWFRRNCKDVLSRECTAAEKADVLAYLLSLQR